MALHNLIENGPGVGASGQGAHMLALPFKVEANMADGDLIALADFPSGVLIHDASIYTESGTGGLVADVGYMESLNNSGVHRDIIPGGNNVSRDTLGNTTAMGSVTAGAAATAAVDIPGAAWFGVRAQDKRGFYWSLVLDVTSGLVVGDCYHLLIMYQVVGNTAAPRYRHDTAEVIPAARLVRPS